MYSVDTVYRTTLKLSIGILCARQCDASIKRFPMWRWGAGLGVRPCTRGLGSGQPPSRLVVIVTPSHWKGLLTAHEAWYHEESCKAGCTLEGAVRCLDGMQPVALRAVDIVRRSACRLVNTPHQPAPLAASMARACSDAVGSRRDVHSEAAPSHRSPLGMNHPI